MVKLLTNLANLGLRTEGYWVLLKICFKRDTVFWHQGHILNKMWNCIT